MTCHVCSAPVPPDTEPQHFVYATDGGVMIGVYAYLCGDICKTIWRHREQIKYEAKQQKEREE